MTFVYPFVFTQMTLISSWKILAYPAVHTWRLLFFILLVELEMMIEIYRCPQELDNIVIILLQVKAETSLAVQTEIQQLRERYQVNLSLYCVWHNEK